MEGTVAHIISGEAVNSAACWVLELDNVSFFILLLERVELGADSVAHLGASATPGVENEANSKFLDLFSHRWLVSKHVEGALSLHGVFWELTEFDLATSWQVKELTDSEGWLVELGGNVGDRGRLELHVGREMAIGHNWLIWHDRLWLRSRCGVRHVMILLLCIWVVVLLLHLLLHLSVWIHLLLLLVVHNLAWVGSLMLLLLSWLAVVGMGLLLLLLSMWVSLLLLLGWLMVGLLLLLLSMWVRLLLSMRVRLLLSMWVSLLLLLSWLVVGLLLLLLLLLSWLMVALLLLLLLLSLLSVWVLLLLLSLLSVWVLVHLLLRGMLVVLLLLMDWVNILLLLGLVIASLLLLSHPGSSGHLRETRVVPIAARVAAKVWHLGSAVMHAPVGRSSASEERTSECFHIFGLLFYDCKQQWISRL